MGYESARLASTKVASSKSAIAPACKMTGKLSASTKTKSAKMNKPNSLTYSSPRYLYTADSSLMYRCTASPPMISAIRYVIADLLDDLKIVSGWVSGKMDEAGTYARRLLRATRFSILKKMNPRNLAAPGVLDWVCQGSPQSGGRSRRPGNILPSRAANINPPSCALQVAGSLTNQEKRRDILRPGKLLSQGLATTTLIHAKVTGFVPQSPEMVKSTGRAAGPRYGQRSYTAYVTPQTVLPVAGRDNGGRDFDLLGATNG